MPNYILPGSKEIDNISNNPYGKSDVKFKTVNNFAPKNNKNLQGKSSEHYAKKHEIVDSENANTVNKFHPQTELNVKANERNNNHLPQIENNLNNDNIYSNTDGNSER